MASAAAYRSRAGIGKGSTPSLPRHDGLGCARRGELCAASVIPDLDIYRSANLIVKHHGQDAPIQAAMRADAMLGKGDLDGYAV